MKQRTNGRAVQGAARESNGARKGLRVGKAAGCMYTADGESERYEYDKVRYIVFRIHRESAARVATRVEGPEGAVFVFVPGRNAYSGETRGSLQSPPREAKVAGAPLAPVVVVPAVPRRRASPIKSPKSHPSTVAFISRAYGIWKMDKCNSQHQ